MIRLQPLSGILLEIVQAKQMQVEQWRASNDFQLPVAKLDIENEFAQALIDSETGIIAEIKFSSPSAGSIRTDKNVEWVAKQYAENGATCLSVLTDTQWFGGDIQYMKRAKQASGLPILNKDFIISNEQIYRAASQGADAILLIVAILAESIHELAATAFDLGLSVLVEVHSQAELELALQCDARCVLGINNRNLKTMHTDIQTSLDLVGLIPPGRVVVSESGIISSTDIKILKHRGIGSFLIGESLMRQENPGVALRKLIS